MHETDVFARFLRVSVTVFLRDYLIKVVHVMHGYLLDHVYTNSVLLDCVYKLMQKLPKPYHTWRVALPYLGVSTRALLDVPLLVMDSCGSRIMVLNDTFVVGPICLMCCVHRSTHQSGNHGAQCEASSGDVDYYDGLHRPSICWLVCLLFLFYIRFYCRQMGFAWFALLLYE